MREKITNSCQQIFKYNTVILLDEGLAVKRSMCRLQIITRWGSCCSVFSFLCCVKTKLFTVVCLSVFFHFVQWRRHFISDLWVWIYINIYLWYLSTLVGKCSLIRPFIADFLFKLRTNVSKHWLQSYVFCYDLNIFSGFIAGQENPTNKKNIDKTDTRRPESVLETNTMWK